MKIHRIIVFIQQAEKGHSKSLNQQILYLPIKQEVAVGITRLPVQLQQGDVIELRSLRNNFKNLSRPFRKVTTQISTAAKNWHESRN